MSATPPSDVNDLLAGMAEDDAADAAADLAVVEAAATVVEQAVGTARAVPIEVDALLTSMVAADATDAFHDAVGDAFGPMIVVDPEPSAAPAIPAQPAELPAVPAQPAELPAVPAQPAEEEAAEPAAVEEEPPAAPAPVIPAQPTEPPAEVRTQKYDLPEGHIVGGGRYPRPGETVDLTPQPEPEPAPAPAPAPEPEPDDDEEPEEEQQEPEAVFPWWSSVKVKAFAKNAPSATPAPPDGGQAPGAPVPPKPSQPPTAGAPAAPAAKSESKTGGSWKPKDKRTRFVLFNGAAAAIGYGVGGSDYVSGFMPAAEHGIVGTFGLAFNLAGWYGAWKLLGHQAVQHVLPYPFIARFVGTLAAGELARNLAPVGVRWVNQYGTEWGLGPNAVSLILTAGIVNGGLYFLVDRRVRHRGALVRFILRIPLATAAVATLLYAPGPTL
ncbi:hypothetical protein [Streptomyces sp. NRRL S-350]|uniref:hypothetical protein n=1 Tax=Streptomyces sp. NRRL S-350 TaxID=1463902 RepID=UPI00068C75D4|nr:hypothetical protein [Streptomyces sp. NRRL S-350]